MPATALIEKYKHAREHGGDLVDLIEAQQALINRGGEIVAPLLSATAHGNLPVEMARELLLQHIWPKIPPEKRKPLVPAIQHHAEQEHSVDSRILALELLAQGMDGYEHGGLSLLPMARDPRVPVEVRCQAIRAIACSRLDGSGMGDVLALLKDPSALIALEALTVVEKQAQLVDPQKASDQLIELLTSLHGNLRRRAIELLGVFGEVDVVERVCALPISDERDKDIEAVQRMVGHVLRKPRSLLSIDPISFEHLVRRLLIAMGFADVRVTAPVRDDGIDVMATQEDSGQGFGKRHRSYIVQCKRHRKPIPAQMIQEFIATLRASRAEQGLFITTSRFTAEALQARESHRIELVDGAQLQALLDKHFRSGQYRSGV